MLLCCLGLVTMQCIEEVVLVDPELVVPSVLQSLGKVKYLLSISNCLWCFVVSSLHVHQDTGKVLCRDSNLFAEKVAPNGLADVREFSAVCTPIFKRYESSVLLSICKWIAIFDCFYVNVRIANFAAINPRTFIWKFSSFSNHLPPVNNPLLKAPQSDFDASACITKFGSFCLSDLPLFNLKFSTH